MSKPTPKEQPDHSSKCGGADVHTPRPSSAPGSVGEPTTLQAEGSSYQNTPRAMPRIPGHEILEELGRGGMGVVYKARQTSLKRIVALKMILAGAHASEEELRRFRREAEAVAQLQHPNIVQIHEIGEHDGAPYFSLEFVDGGNLAQRLHGVAQESVWSAQLLEAVARAVQVAHDQDIVHRDLKPGNILLTRSGSPKVADFGLAKRLAGEADHTRTGAIVGTPSYMAPEMAGGSHQAVGPAVDVYALGAILYELLTGRPPFRRETPLDTLLDVREREPVRPRALNRAAPRDLETICLKALAKDPSRRYASAGDFAADLSRFLDGQPIHARRVGRLQRSWRWCRRNAAMTTMMAAIGMLVIVASLVWNKDRAPDTVADNSLKRVQQARKIVVATDPTYPPMAFTRDGKLQGFDVDYARELARRLGVEAEIVAIDWDWQELVNQLDTHAFDMIISAVTITEPRLRQVEFAAYERLRLVAVCRRGVNLVDERSLTGLTVAVQTDTTTHQLALSLKRDGIDIKQILVFPGAAEPFDSVRLGQADVTLAHLPVALYYAKQCPDLVVTGPLGRIGMIPDEIGVVFCKKDNALRQAVADAVLEMNRDGTASRLRAPWFGE